MILFPTGVQGLADTRWQGAQGQAHRLVGIDHRSEPGLIKVQQKLTKDSGDTIDELCKVALPVSDGSTLWFSSVSGKIWREVDGVYTLIHTLTIPGWDLSTATTSGKDVNVSAEISSPTGAWMNADGLKFYLMDAGVIYEYDLETAFDIATATYSTNFFDTTGQTSSAAGIFLRADGIKLFVTDGNDIYRYTLSTPYDISTATYDTHTSAFAEDTDLVGMAFKSDGTALFVSGRQNDKVYSYTLGTPWDLTTKSFVDDFSIVTEVGDYHMGFYMKPDGTRFFMLDNTSSERVTQFSLGTAWDLTTATYDNLFFKPEVGSILGIGGGFMFADDGRHFYITGSNAPETVHQFDLAAEDLNVTVLGAEEYGVFDGTDGDDEDEDDDELAQYIYFATRYWFFRIAVADIGFTDWFDTTSKVDYLTLFKNGDDTYHPMKKQNNRLFVGDRYCLLEVNEFGVITLETDFNVMEPERITALGRIDVDLLVGTKERDKAWVKRWDTEALSWYAEDSVKETEIYAFLEDDNFVYVIAGDFGRMYFYDGEKMLPDVRVPGQYSKTARGKVNHNAVASFMGIPVFGFSNIVGNPAWQGVYAYGRYSKDYNVTMDLSFPLSCNMFSDIEIGAIIVNGFDLMISFKSETGGIGVDRIDWTAKYESAFIESMVLLGAADRRRFKSIDEVLADYFTLPEGTGLEFSISNNYKGYQDLELETKDNVKLNQILAKATLKELGAVEALIEFNVDGNVGPEVENFHVRFVGEES
jgi:hypothetical protein